MKRLLLACSLVGAIAAAQAQPPHDPVIDAQKRSVQLQKTLQLSDEQAAKVKTIFENTDQQRKALMEKYKPQFEAFRADQKSLHDQTHQQLAGVLTPKQLVALQELEKHRSKHGGMHRGGPDGDHHGEDRGQPPK
jgi:Spy/CpxP family protein refolding chaperone